MNYESYDNHVNLGIDIGSTTVKIVLLDKARNILFSAYKRHLANIQETLTELLSSATDALGNLIVHPMITGSGGLSLANHLEVPFNQEVIAVATALKDLGIDVLSTANNHSLDTKYDGLVSTLNYLDKEGISHTGTYSSEEAQNEILIKDINGIKIAFLAFTYGTNGDDFPMTESKTLYSFITSLIKLINLRT